MRKLKSLKGKTRRKKGWVEFDDEFFLPIKTLSVAEEIMFSFDEHIEVPTIQRRATAEEVEQLKQEDPSFNSKIIPFIKIYDKSSQAYAENLQEKEKLEQIASIIKYVDMDFKNEDELTLWEDFEIEKGDYYELSKYFAYELCLSSQDLEKILHAVKGLQGESVFEKLAMFEKLSNQDMSKILNYVYEGVRRENENVAEMVEKGNQAMKIAEDMNKNYEGDAE
ncbi:MAG: hypothetical protein ACRDD8_05340 [Bacteroidales bacterium]